jgi:hypothetical protein
MPKTRPAPAQDFYGLILYTIERNGCLNGVYTNTGCNGVIYNEIARKPVILTTGIDGDYDCQYFDIASTTTNARETCILRITPEPVSLNFFKFEWIDYKNAANILFEGRGYQMDDRHISVYYW